MGWTRGSSCWHPRWPGCCKKAWRIASEGLFQAAFLFNNSELELPVQDTVQAAEWYTQAFGLAEVDRPEGTAPSVILERDGVRLGFAVNGGTASNEGAAILVSDIHQARTELESNGVTIANWRIDERDGRRCQVVFVVARMDCDITSIRLSNEKAKLGRTIRED